MTQNRTTGAGIASLRHADHISATTAATSSAIGKWITRTCNFPTKRSVRSHEDRPLVSVVARSNGAVVGGEAGEGCREVSLGAPASIQVRITSLSSALSVPASASGGGSSSYR